MFHLKCIHGTIGHQHRHSSITNDMSNVETIVVRRSGIPKWIYGTTRFDFSFQWTMVRVGRNGFVKGQFHFIFRTTNPIAHGIVDNRNIRRMKFSIFISYASVKVVTRLIEAELTTGVDAIILQPWRLVGKSNHTGACGSILFEAF